MPAYMIQEINTMFEKVIWNGNKAKIPPQVLTRDKNDGGIGLVDMLSKDNSLKTSWIKMLLEGSYPEEIPYSILHPGLHRNIWCVNLKDEDVKKTVDAPNIHTFWVDVLKSWCRYHFTEVRIR